MPRASNMPSRRSLPKSRSVRPVSEFTFPNLMPISTCQVSWKVFSAPGGGWHPGSAKLEVSPEAPQRKPPPKRMAVWGDDRGRQPAIKRRKNGLEDHASSSPKSIVSREPRLVRCDHAIDRAGDLLDVQSSWKVRVRVPPGPRRPMVVGKLAESLWAGRVSQSNVNFGC